MPSRTKACCVLGCENRVARRYTITTEENCRKIWFDRIGNAKLLTLNEKQIKNLRICQIHFHEDCVEVSGKLKKYSLPSLHLPGFKKGDGKIFYQDSPKKFKYDMILKDIEVSGPTTLFEQNPKLDVIPPNRTYSNLKRKNLAIDFENSATDLVMDTLNESGLPSMDVQIESNPLSEKTEMENGFSNLCRCCMEPGEISVFHTFFESLKLADIIQKYTGQSVFSEEFPENICQVCYDKLITWHSFAVKCLQVQEHFSNISKSVKVEQINVTEDIKDESVDYNNEDDVQMSDTEDAKNESSDDEKPLSMFKNVCQECEANFTLLKHLLKHCKETGHTPPKRFQCQTCLKKFTSTTRLKEHMRIHNNERPYECEQCKMTFTLNCNLKRHIKKHTGEKSYFCQVCGKGFIQKNTLTVHMRMHNGETPFVCKICAKGYRTKPLLQQHMYKHKDSETQTIKYQKYYLKYGKMKVECKQCKKIITKSALYNHMKVQHGDGLKKFLCNSCGKTYATKMSLDVHMNVHTKKIAYDCHVCSKSFTHQNYLKTHLLLHSGERPHCCDVCGKTFVQKTHLDRHMRTHSGAKPYVCKFCDRAFALNENLKVHVRTHTGETTHHCSACGKGYFNSSSKKKHEIRVHRMHQK